MSKYRKGRINDAVAEELSIAVGELADPRISLRLVSITHAEVSPDLKLARVWFSCMDEPEEVLAALRGATGALRHALAERLNLRITPDLVFLHDGSLAHGARIAELLEQIHRDEKPEGTEK